MAEPHLVSDLIGSGLEIAGTFFLSVEAIKIPNLRKLRTAAVQKPLRFLTPRIMVPIDTPEEKVAALVEKKKGHIALLLSLVGFGALVFVGVLLHVSLFGLWLSIRDASPSLPGNAIFSGLTVFAGTVTLSYLAGFFLYKLITVPFVLLVHLLAWIEAKTESGIIGILGFALFLSGAVIHICLKLVG